MTSPSDEELDRLLARGRMSGPERGRVLERVLDATAPKRSRIAGWAGVFAFVTAGAVAAIFFLRLRSEPADTFTSKGGTAAATPRLDIECIDGDRTRCASGSTLVIRAQDCAAGGFVAAYAEHAKTKERIWYFPSQNEATLPEVLPKAEAQVLSRGARIGPAQAPGTYIVTMVLAKRSLTQDEIVDSASPDILHRWTSTIEITP